MAEKSCTTWCDTRLAVAFIHKVWKRENTGAPGIVDVMVQSPMTGEVATNATLHSGNIRMNFCTASHLQRG